MRAPLGKMPLHVEWLPQGDGRVAEPCPLPTSQNIRRTNPQLCGILFLQKYAVRSSPSQRTPQSFRMLSFFQLQKMRKTRNR
jgi:hypothetical protein